MSNMSYCRFRNTLEDLVDCQGSLYDDLSEDERCARIRLIKVAFQIVEDFLDEDGGLNLEMVEDLQPKEIIP